MSCITTFTGASFDPTAPEVNKLNIHDVAHALSMLCRANGHFPVFYSVAQHCLNCMAEAQARGYSRRVQMACLLHDAAEAYLQDIPRPVKIQLAKYNELEEALLQIIWSKWLDAPLTKEEYRQVFEIDDALLYTEFHHFMNQEIITPQSLKIEPILCTEPFEAVEQRYLQEFYRLTATDTDKAFVGVDWCKGKWMAVTLSGGTTGFKLYHDIAALCNDNQTAASILIDIPIGLAKDRSEEPFRPDAEARSCLNNRDGKSWRTSSVFPAPYRDVVYSEDYETANALSKKLGKGLSLASWGFCSAIRQVDEFLQSNPQWKNRLLESHPEVAFQALNRKRPLSSSKKYSDGIQERIGILEAYCLNIREIVQTAKKSMHNDILDAACLAVTGMLGNLYGFSTIPASPVADSTGLMMQMVMIKNILTF